MNLLQCSRLAVCALFLSFLGGCGGSSNNQTAPQTVTTFYSSSAIFKNHTSAMVMAGYNAFGQLGTGNLDNQAGFNAPSGVTLSRINGFAAGGAHTLAFQNNSSVQAWGSNMYGQLGDGSTTTGSSAVSKSPVTVKKASGAVLSHVTGVAAGGYHSLAISDHNVYAWGNNGSGQLGGGDASGIGFTDQHTAVQVVDQDGVALSDIVEVAAGGTCSFARNSQGQVYAWGNNTNGQLGPGLQTPGYVNKATLVNLGFPVKAISAAGSYAVAIRASDNTVWAWGYDYWGQIGIDPRDPANAPLLATDANGNTVTYVDHPTQIMMAGSTPTNPIPLLADKVVAGSDHVLALAPDKTVWAWGQDYYGQLGNNNKATLGHPGDQNTTLYFSATPVQVVDPASAPNAGTGGATPLTDVKEIYAYGNSSFAMTSTGKLVAWGANVYGQLGFSDQSKLGYQENPFVVTGF